MIEIRDSNAEEFAKLFPGVEPEKFAAAGGWFFAVVVGSSNLGGFWVIPRAAGAELHTELKLRGAEAIAAAEQLKTILADRYAVSRLTGYVEHANRPAKIFAAKIGFRRVCDDAEKTYYEQWLRTPSTSRQ